MTKKDEKTEKYLHALEIQDQNPKLSWNQCCTNCNISSKYPYLSEMSRKPRLLEGVSYVMGLIDNNDEVALAFKERIMQKFGLKERAVTAMERAFCLSEYKTEELLKDLKNRGVKMENVRVMKKIVHYEEESIEY